LPKGFCKSQIFILGPVLEASGMSEILRAFRSLRNWAQVCPLGLQRDKNVNV